MTSATTTTGRLLEAADRFRGCEILNYFGLDENADSVRSGARLYLPLDRQGNSWVGRQNIDVGAEGDRIARLGRAAAGQQRAAKVLWHNLVVGNLDVSTKNSGDVVGQGICILRGCKLELETALFSFLQFNRLL